MRWAPRKKSEKSSDSSVFHVEHEKNESHQAMSIATISFEKDAYSPPKGLAERLGSL